MTTLFISAKWKHLIMLNYEVHPAILVPFIPKGTQLDFWNGKAYLSLVGFLFLDTYVRGFAIPFHRNFEEVNLRFYVKKNNDERRGVAFIKEIVPKWGIAYIARRQYNENYISLPMKHEIIQTPNRISAEYLWKYNGKWHKMVVDCQGEPYLPTPGSDEEFITEHYWGYSVQHDGETLEYEVKHPQWRIWKGTEYNVEIDLKDMYGPTFASYLEREPSSVFLAEGSQVEVYRGQRL